MTMNLSGSLDSFGLDEVLSLLAMGGRTARMQVSGPQAVGVVHLVDGELSSASADVRRAGLLRQVVAAGQVPVSDLAEALEHPQPVRALLDSGAVDAERVRGLADEHVVEALAELLTWGEGEFAVWTGEGDDGDVGLRVPVADAIERARARAGEWQRVRAALPEGDSVLALAPELGQSTTLEVEDWTVLARVDGRRTLAEVLVGVGVAPLLASDRVVSLLGRGLLAVRTGEVVEPDEADVMLTRYEDGPAAVAVVVEPDGQGALVEPLAEETSQEAAGEVEPVAPVVEPAAFAAPVDVAVAPVAFEEPVGFAAPAALVDSVAFVDPVDVVAEPVVFEQPAGFEESAGFAATAALAEPVAFVDPVDVVAEPVAFVDPVVPTPAVEVPVAPALQWSPWAQALGLGAPAPEGELIVDPLAGPGIAEMIADAHSLTETEHVPVPLAPVVPQWAPDAAVEFVAPFEGELPGPRTPEAETWTPDAAAQAWLAAASPVPGLTPPVMAATAMDPAPLFAPAPVPVAGAVPVDGTVPVTDEGAAGTEGQGGLLSQLLPGMRGN